MIKTIKEQIQQLENKKPNPSDINYNTLIKTYNIEMEFLLKQLKNYQKLKNNDNKLF